MISSAVVIPESEPEQVGPSSLKRRQSSISSDSSKRPRLEAQNSFENGGAPTNGGPMSPPSRRRSGLGAGAVEEKKRGQRLFGALLGTLSQTSSKPAHRKRDEIEQRQRERLRKDTEEREEEKRRKREELDKLRRIEQKEWEKESTRIRHQNMRAMAGFLQTKTEPRLFFKPWQLRDEEEDQIKRQIKEIDEKIKAELGEVDTSEGMDIDRDQHGPAQNDRRSDSHGDATLNRNEEPFSSERHNSEPDRENDDPREGSTELNSSGGQDADVLGLNSAEEDRHKEDDHAGEELVEGQEDDVIY